MSNPGRIGAFVHEDEGFMCGKGTGTVFSVAIQKNILRKNAAELGGIGCCGRTN
jgi:hypothetical protein